MQFILPAQIFVVLWLFAATAPAATALMNGSMAVFFDGRTGDTTVRVARVPDRAQAEARTDESDPGAPVSFSGYDLHATFTFEGATVLKRDATISQQEAAEEQAQHSLALPIIHTELQRHRPKGA